MKQSQRKELRHLRAEMFKSIEAKVSTRLLLREIERKIYISDHLKPQPGHQGVAARPGGVHTSIQIHIYIGLVGLIYRFSHTVFL